MSIFGIIPARGESEGIPRKNLTLLNNRPLIDYTIQAAKESTNIDRFLVSSDSEEIMSHCRALDVEVLQRPGHLARAESSIEPTIIQVLEILGERENYRPVWVVLLQSTSPLRTGQDIDSAFDLLKRSNADGVISVFEPAHTPYKALILDEQGRLKGLMGDSAPFMRRQDCPRVYCANGAIYVFRASDFLASGRITLRNAIPYIMPADRSVDIDDVSDLRTAESAIAANDSEFR